MKRVLVANRGEIACRVMAALREEGMDSVAVYSEADREAAHVRAADRAVEIGPESPAESYLNAERILQAARDVEADAVHPGYGFLAENADFAAAVEDAGLVFIGPAPETIALLGDKRRARAAAVSAGVPVVPGWEGDASDIAGATAAAEDMGWPVLVKAALGGGGKGMARVESAGELASAMEGAARVASSAFGDASLYLEKWIARPRHVEVQVLGDGRGGVVHLFERECTLQRRHQKIVEESPSPALGDRLRTALTDAAVAVAREAAYRSAGTCEFLLDPNGGFYFLEVNARIQVEHPVTELVTGRDLVREQLRMAVTGELGFAQEEVTRHGAAVEARLYAEDPDDAFLPRAGELLRVEFPRRPWLRVDSGVATGDCVSSSYDPMLAKVITWGADRAEAWWRLRLALDETVIHGPGTNLPFLRDLLADDAVASGEYHTTMVEEEFLPRRAEEKEGTADLLLVAAALADSMNLAAGGAGTDRAKGAPAHPDPWDTMVGWRLRGRAGGGS
ncbi:MAG: biotin carboxylase N-terminal domain-containing protein [Gemmatimonadota bacterium]|nr:biotin carboxylase N-terminal domain-containing protein [Gemmatimonadota bacterium]